eukprot:4862786-Pleurochrysis_carterae.AAC.2
MTAWAYATVENEFSNMHAFSFVSHSPVDRAAFHIATQEKVKPEIVEIERGFALLGRQMGEHTYGRHREVLQSEMRSGKNETRGRICNHDPLEKQNVQ